MVCGGLTVSFLSLSLALSHTQCCEHKVGTLLQLRFKFGSSVKMALLRLTHVAVMFFIIPVLGDRDNQSQVVLDSVKVRIEQGSVLSTNESRALFKPHGQGTASCS